MSSDEDSLPFADIFQEPENFRELDKQATYTEYSMLSGQSLRLRLVGHNPLWVPRPAAPEVLHGLFADVCSFRVTTSGTVVKS